MRRSDASEIGYMPRLDGLRCLAVSGVLPVHFVRGWIAHWYGESGHLGVHLFFVLSGYLIATNLLRYRDRIDLGQATRGSALLVFYVRRMLRLSPTYYAYLGIACLMMRGLRPYLPWFFLYGQNFLFATRPVVFEKYLAHFWTLAIEEQFYLVVPILLLTAPRPWMMRLSCGFVACAMLFRTAGLALHFGEFPIGLMMPAQMDALGAGVLLAVSRWRASSRPEDASDARVLEKHTDNPLRTPAGADSPLVRFGWTVGLPLWLACRTAHAFEPWRGIGFVFEDFGLALVLMAVVAAASRPSSAPGWAFLEYAPIAYIGRISYGIYVYHFNVPGLTRDVIFPRLGLALPDSPARQFLLFTAVTIVVASLSYYLYERPFVGLKRHVSLGEARATRPAAVPAATTT